jgi:hypothetical protein
MLQKFKMKKFAAVLGLFGFVLFPAAPVFASVALDERFEQCQSIKPNGDLRAMKRKKNCFKELVGDERQAAAGHITLITRNLNADIKELDNNIADLCNTARDMLSDRTREGVELQSLAWPREVLTRAIERNCE